MLSLKQLANYAGQLSLAMRSGIPISSVMRSLSKSAPTRRLRYISKSIGEEIDSGSSLEKAFREFDRDFPDMFISLIAAGEKTGHMEQVAAQIAAFYETRQRIVSAMKWDLVTIGVYLFLCVSLIIFIYYVIGGWDSTIIMRNGQNIAIAVIFFILLPWALYKNVRFFRSIIAVILQAVPFLGSALRKLSIARFSSTMAMGINAGLDIRKAIEYSAQAMANPFLERRARRAIDNINNGKGIAESLSMTGIFPTLVCHMYETGEMSGTLFDMMQKVASFTQDEAENALRTISQIVPRAIYLFIIGFIAYMIISLWQRIYSGIFDAFNI